MRARWRTTWEGRWLAALILAPLVIASSATAVPAQPPPRVGVFATAVSARPPHHSRPHRGRPLNPHRFAHVLLISVDGLHESDLEWYTRRNPGSALAKLARAGIRYENARTPIPSTSFAGILAQVTGGDPRVTGVYSGGGYTHELLAPGTKTCRRGEATGTPVRYDDSIDRNPASIAAGQPLAGLPGTILRMTGLPQSLIDPAKLPVDPRGCRPVYPHRYLKVNTIFEVARNHGLRTAWSDDHPAYEILNGPSGRGVEDLFTPELGSQAIGYPPGVDWSQDNAATIRYDSYKVAAVLNEIAGHDHGATRRTGVPGIFGLNFQAVASAQQLPTSDGLAGGYRPGSATPGPLLRRALDSVDASLGRMLRALAARRLARSTAIIVSARHGQSPQNPRQLTRIDDGPIIDAINAAWNSIHPAAGKLIVAASDHDMIQMWLSDRSEEAAIFVEDYLLTHSVTGTTVSGGSRTLAGSGLIKAYAGLSAANYFGVSPNDSRHPDVWGVARGGVLYPDAQHQPAGHAGKALAAHGGAGAQDQDVPLVVFAPGRAGTRVVRRQVQSTQIAPTILQLLGLDPRALHAVAIEGTPALPDL
ncbi:MAG: alkaline phosphatase family protein [Solirubrobacteraceae bacterium]